MKRLTIGLVMLLVLVGAGQPAFSVPVAKIATGDDVPFTVDTLSKTPAAAETLPEVGFDELDFDGTGRLYAMLDDYLNLSGDAAALAEPPDAKTGNLDAVVGRDVPDTARSDHAKGQVRTGRTLSQILESPEPADRSVLLGSAGPLVEAPPEEGTAYEIGTGTIPAGVAVALLVLLMLSPVLIAVIYLTHKRLKAMGVY